LNSASLLFGEAKELQEKLFSSALSNDPIDIEKVEQSVDGIMTSVFRNQDALLLLSRLKDKDAYLFEHAINCCILMTTFATYLEYDEGLIHEVAVGSFMHDIGKVLIPKSILNKPGKLTDEEFEQMEKHAAYSQSILEKIPGISAVSVDIAANHHEQMDSYGYPNQLKGDELTTWGCMMSIVDTYDAMTSDKCYRDACTPMEAFKAMLNDPTHYDQQLVQQFIKCLGIFPLGAMVKLKSGRLGMVYKVNSNSPMKPVVVTFYSINQRQHTELKYIDLSRSENDEIEVCVKPEDFDIQLNRELIDSLFISAHE